MKTRLSIGLLAVLSTATAYAVDYPVQPASGSSYTPGVTPAAGPALYFCTSAEAYYPYVTTCPGGWRVVSLDAQAGFDQGMAAYRRQDFPAALEQWRPLAYIGNALAQFTLGTMYQNGNGVPLDHAEAAKWFRLAAGQGRADAQNNLGGMYEIGQGVPQDYQLAVKWYRRAADQGYAYAQFNMGDMYANGQGVAQDYREAARWYRLAAEQGYADAQFTLGMTYENGQGVAQDDKEAVKWYGLAADQGYADAQNNLGEMYANGKGVPQSRVVAYALYNLAASNAAAANGNAGSNLEKLSSSMTAADIAAGSSLLQEMRNQGMLLKALERYLRISATQKGTGILIQPDSGHS
jgi:TPR repeat protein